MNFARSRAVIPTERKSKPLIISSLDFFFCVAGRSTKGIFGSMAKKAEKTMVMSGYFLTFAAALPVVVMPVEVCLAALKWEPE